MELIAVGRKNVCNCLPYIVRHGPSFHPSLHHCGERCVHIVRRNYLKLVYGVSVPLIQLASLPRSACFCIFAQNSLFGEVAFRKAEIALHVLQKMFIAHLILCIASFRQVSIVVIKEKSDTGD